MCGVAGIIDPKIINKEKVVGDMVARIFHRGPDQDGFFVDSNVGLGMRRLSIIDLDTGKQPIWSFDRKTCIFYNGEIYNYLELRKELMGKGVEFSTSSDTEVILQMYEMYGDKMLPKLRGMFVFCIYNIETKKIFIARDYFGIKPLYYLQHKNKIVAFSSEIKSFLSFPEFIAEVNDAAVYNYLSFQYNPLTETFFQHVYKLPPAHYMSIDTISGDTKIEKYWSFEFNQTPTSDTGAEIQQKTEKETTQEILETITDSVKHHMIADVPVGSFLSGGIDSSIIATLMQQIRGDNKIKTFTVGFETLTEGIEATETSDFLGTDHTEIKVTRDEYFSVLPQAVWHFDEPVADPSAIGLYFVSREARKHVTVVLSGEGADELFGGYNIYLAPYAYRKIAWVSKTMLEICIKLPLQFWGKNYMRRAHEELSMWYIGNASIFKQNEIDIMWKKTSRQSKLKLLSLKPLFDKISHLSDSTKMQYIDIHTWLVGDILAKADKMTMAHSLELRVPFLDKKVSDLASTLPDTYKWRNGKTKYLLREAFKKIIPESTRNRKKLGFPTPVRDWFTVDQTEIYDTILANTYIASRMNTEYIKNLINDHIAKKNDNSRKIYLLLMLALWYNIFIEVGSKKLRI